MRLLLALVFFLPTLALAQELHTFKNGEVADADKINETHQYILNNASGGGGCSVEQVDNTAEITCADGTTAVVPGYGTVVVVPEGTVGEVDTSSLNTGDVVAIDAMDVTLGKVKRTIDEGATFTMALLPDSEYPEFALANIESTRKVFAGGGARIQIYFSEENCQGQVILPTAYYIACRPDTGVCVIPVGDRYETLLTKSFIWTLWTSFGSVHNEEAQCRSVENVVPRAYLGASYTFAPEILNAAYPVRLEQLP